MSKYIANSPGVIGDRRLLLKSASDLRLCRLAVMAKVGTYGRAEERLSNAEAGATRPSRFAALPEEA